MPRALVAERQLVQDALGDRAAVRPGEQALLLEQLEVAADRRRRDVEPVARSATSTATVRGELGSRIADEAFGLVHGADDSPRVRVHARSGLTSRTNAH